MSQLPERPWLDPDDFQGVAQECDTWTDMARLYTARGYPVSRDTMRRSGETHGIAPAGSQDQTVVVLRSEVKRLERQLRDIRREANSAISQAQAQPREVEPEEVLAARKRIDILQRQLEHERKLNKAGVREANLIDAVREILEPIVQDYALPPVEPPSEMGASDGTPISLGLVWCDQHWGKNVDPVTINGVNAYNPTIAALRYEDSVEKFRKLRRLWANEHPVDELVIILNGDPVNNDHQLHPDDAADIGRVSKQVADCALVTAQAIYDLAHDFPLIRVICCGSDNHGRGGKKPAAGRAGIENSWTALYHEQVASLCINLLHVEFDHVPSYQALFMVKGRCFAAAHGHQLRGGGGQLGIPAYAMKRHADSTLQKTVSILKARDWSGIDSPESLAEAVAGLVDHLVLSHFHSRQILDTGNVDIRLAPSLCGSDPYTVNSLGKIARAGVLAFVVHPRHGIIADHLIDVQDVEEGDAPRYKWGCLEDGTTGAALMREWLIEQDMQ